MTSTVSSPAEQPARRFSAASAARGLLTAAGIAIALGGLGWLAYAWNASRLPGTYDVMDYGRLDYGGGPVPAGHHGHAGGHSISLAALRGPQGGKPDASFTLTAKTAEVRLASGAKVDALTFNGQAPGPELRVRQGDLVEVTLRNDDVDAGVSIHWHGVDVPNAEDGVSGVTQDAVLPGGRHVYRFRVEQAGTFWYHTHQDAAEEVERGLFGPLVIVPRRPLARGTLDLALIAHDFEGIATLNSSDRLEHRAVPPGTPVRLRLINSDNAEQLLTVTGTPFKVVAIDGTDLNGPTPVQGKLLRLGGGGRYDIAFTMPETPVEISIPDTAAGLVLSRDGMGTLAAAKPGPDFDPAAYGVPAATTFDASSHYVRHFRFDIGRKPGFLDGKPGNQWTVNGGIYPDVPVFVVQRGDLVRVSIANHTSSIHPMHLHGHHVLVLSRNGNAVSGSPWWVDTLDVAPGDRYEVAFRADNPGLWMDHCHNLRHAAAGLTMHVAYAGVTTPFRVGSSAHNRPE
jgi:FtsP/CotA-like multicopper oxidase with cupredoxin domain